MSLLSDFVAEGFSAARAVIGGESVAIAGGTALSVVAAESRYARDYETGGFDREESLTVVVSTPEFSAAYTSALASYLGKTATARSATWRVESIDKGVSTTAIELQSVTDTA